jgi:hypothetical protein
MNMIRLIAGRIERVGLGWFAVASVDQGQSRYLKVAHCSSSVIEVKEQNEGEFDDQSDLFKVKNLQKELQRQRVHQIGPKGAIGAISHTMQGRRIKIRDPCPTPQGGAAQQVKGFVPVGPFHILPRFFSDLPFRDEALG